MVQQVLFEAARPDMPQAPVPWLTEADPAQWQVAPGWRTLVDGFWAGAQGRMLKSFLAQRMAEQAVVYPPRPLRALELTPPEAVRVVILGQDPYHGPGQAEGLAFSVAPGMPVPPSLRNIFKELSREPGVPVPANGSLVRWTEQGVLLLNAVLTVEDGQAASHAGRGWEALTDAVVKACSDEGQDKVFMLWGAHAQRKSTLISARHRVLTANHPSPLSASRPPVPFLGCGHFTEANRWLRDHGGKPVAW
ncbi:MAG: uracil-DNA glycosylase [Gammaproteobacteria bacterium]